MTDPTTDEKLVRTWEPLHREGDAEGPGVPDGVDPFDFFNNENGSSDR